MTGIMEFAGIWKKRSQVFATPSYYVFKMYANTDISRQVAVTANAGSYSVAQGVRRLPDIGSVPYLDVAAALSRDGKTLTLFCVNRSLATNFSANIRLHDFSPVHTVAVHTLSSPSLTDSNDEVTPTRVKTVDSEEDVQADGWTHTFPHASVTVISLHGN
jgi:alpha-N-arabinofuranosidase